MASMTKNNSTWTYTYDSNGLRTGRTNGVTSYEYVYSGDLLKQMTVTDVASGAKQVLTFTYDATGTPLTLDLDGTVYYYLTNIQGDVTGIVDSTGNLLIQYVYEGYGKSYFINDTSDLTVTLGSINPLAYRAYVFDMGTALYYLQSRYYDQFLGRFLNADGLVSTGQGLLCNNMFAYCLNNPVNMYDPSGKIAITTLILIGSAIVGAVCAGYTAYKEYNAGFGTTQIIGDSICAGFMGFSIVYTGGMTLYQCYQNFCYLNAITPVTDIGSTTSVSNQLQACADTANAQVSGKGPVVGTMKHSVFAQEVNALNNSRLATEVSYKNGQVVPYGTAGSIRFDVMQYNQAGVPIAAWDFKTGAATLTVSRIDEMLGRSGLFIPIYEVR